MGGEGKLGLGTAETAPGGFQRRILRRVSTSIGSKVDLAPARDDMIESSEQKNAFFAADKPTKTQVTGKTAPVVMVDMEAASATTDVEVAESSQEESKV